MVTVLLSCAFSVFSSMGKMFDRNGKFYLKTIKFMDTISAVGLLSTEQTFLNKTKLLYSILVSVLATLAAVIFFNPFITRTSNKLLNTYLTLSGFSGLLCSAVLIVRLSFRSVNKKKALLEADLIGLRIEKHSISKSKSAALDFCKEFLFIMQYFHATLYLLLHGTSIYYIVTASKVHKGQLLYKIASVFLSLFHISIHYSFTMLNLFCLEYFFKIKEEILATAHPKNLTLCTNKMLPPVDRIGSSVFTIRSQSCGWFKDIRSKQLRTTIRDYCLLEDISIFMHYWHSAPLTCLLTAEATYIPTLPMNRNPYEHVWFVQLGSYNQFIFFVLLFMTVVSMIASNVYYRYTKHKLRKSLGKYFYRSSEVQVQRQLINFKLFLSCDMGADHWKWLTLDCSLLSTTFDTSVLIFTTFLAEMVY